jgi:hypothetical protein
MEQQPLVDQGLLLIDQSSRRRDLYLKNTSFTRDDVYARAEYEPANPASESTQNHTLYTHGSWDRQMKTMSNIYMKNK